MRATIMSKLEQGRKGGGGGGEDKRQNFDISLSRVTMLRTDGGALTNSE